MTAAEAAAAPTAAALCLANAGFDENDRAGNEQHGAEQGSVARHGSPSF
jgi:hypothetical protein